MDSKVTDSLNEMCKRTFKRRLCIEDIKISNFFVDIGEISFSNEDRFELYPQIDYNIDYKGRDLTDYLFDLQYYVYIEHHVEYGLPIGRAHERIKEIKSTYYSVFFNYGLLALDEYENRHYFGRNEIDNRIRQEVERLFNNEIQNKFDNGLLPDKESYHGVDMKYLFKYSETLSRKEHKERLCSEKK